MPCPSCASDVPAGAKFCPECAAPLGGGGAARDAAVDPLRDALQRAVGGQFEVVRRLGRGGMGAVYLARERALDREVAIKVLPPDGAGEDERERFRREARLAARLTHPGIVPLHAFGEADATLYFVMGLVRGEPLSARMQRGLTVEASRRVLMDLADALDYAHRQGVVHRDVKPENVLIDDDSGRPMLTDFGIAKAAGAAKGLTATGSVVGTPHFMSPEQAAGKSEVDARSDVYSLGAMGYAMLAGRLPFDGGSVGDVLVQHMTKDPPPLASVAPDVPEALAAVVMRCLAKSPLDRWPDAGRLREALAAAGDTAEMPEGLQPVASLGLLALAIFAVALGFEAAQWLWRGRLESLPPLGLPTLQAFVLCVAGLLYRALPARRAGFRWATIARASLASPLWWRWWYPASLRRPEDEGIWDRLPARVRRDRLFRVLVPVAGALSLATFVAIVSPRGNGLKAFPLLRAAFLWPPVVNGVRDIPPLGPVVLGLGWTLLGPLALVHHRRCRAWLSGLGLSEHEQDGVLAGPLVRPAFWRRRPVTALLAAAGEPDVSPPRTPAEIAQAIEAAADAVGGGDSAVIREAGAAARNLLASVEEADREIARLAADASPEEKARLQGRLDGLGAPASGEPDERRRLRALFAQQMELLVKLEGRLEDAVGRRARRIEMLKALWLEVASLRAAASLPGRGKTSERVKDLCSRIATERQAVETLPDRGPEDDRPTLAR